MKYLIKIDSIFLNQMMSSCNEVFKEFMILFSNFFCNCLSQIFEKAQFLVQLLQTQISASSRELVEKNLRTIIYNLSNLQESYALSFKNILDKYISFCLQIIDHRNVFKNEEILKSSLWCVIKVLRSNDYQHNR